MDNQQHKTSLQPTRIKQQKPSGMRTLKSWFSTENDENNGPVRLDAPQFIVKNMLLM
jgi:hypothetical protein